MLEIKRLKQRVPDVERQRDEAKDKLREKTKEYYAAAVELEEEKGKNLKLTAQVNRDRVHAAFPEGYVNAVNYDGSVKAFAFLLTNECNVFQCLACA